jgi:hypothetical protein
MTFGGLVVRDARRCRAPHHEGHLLPPREAAGRGVHDLLRCLRFSFRADEAAREAA